MCYQTCQTVHVAMVILPQHTIMISVLCVCMCVCVCVCVCACVCVCVCVCVPTHQTLDRGQTFCPSQQTLDSSFSSTFSNASAPPLLQHSSRDHLHRFVPSGAHQKLGRSMSSLLFSEHKPTTVHRVKYQSPVPSELPPLDLPSWELAVSPNPVPRKSLKPTYVCVLGRMEVCNVHVCLACVYVHAYVCA